MSIALDIFPDSHVLTHSSETAFRVCPRRYELLYVHGLRPAIDSDALRIGKAFHAGLEAVKTSGNEIDGERAVRNAYADAKCPPYLTPEEFAVEEVTSAAMVLAWARRWRGDRIARYVAIELPFDLPIINPHSGKAHPTLRNRGRIDGIAELPDGRLALVEHKTAGEDIAPGADYWQKLMMDAQISRYWSAAHALGYPVDTVIYDVTRKPLIRPKAIAKADRALATSRGNYFGIPLLAACPERETPRLYGARVLADMTERPAFYFNRVEIPRLDSDLRQFALDHWSAVRGIAECAVEGYWPRNTAACTSPYRCQFLDVCRGLRGDPDEQIPEGFRRAERLHPELIEANDTTNAGQGAGEERTCQQR